MSRKSNVYKLCRCRHCRAGRRKFKPEIYNLKKKIRRDGIENVKVGLYTD